MKLSDAIRLGTMLRPNQAFGVLFDPADPSATCVMGAAAEAVGILDTTQYSRYTTDRREKVPREWHPLALLRPRCPACETVSDVSDLLRHLNNDHRWTRERIADWVETLESAEQPAVTEATNSDAVAAPVVLGK